MTFDIQLCSLGEYQTLEDQLTKKCKAVGLTEEEYELEFSHTRNCLNEALSEWWSSENADYMIMEEHWRPFCRILSMGIYGPRTFSIEFLTTVQTLLAALPHEWVIHIAAEPEFPGHELDWALVFITREKVYIYPILSEGETNQAYPALFQANFAERADGG